MARGLITSSQKTTLRFTSHETNSLRFHASQKIEVVQNAKNVTLVPFCKTVSASIRVLNFYEPIDSQEKPAIGES